MRYLLRRRPPIPALVFLSLSAACAVAAFASVSAYGARIRAARPPVPDTQEVVVAARPIQLGALIQAGDVTLATVAIQGLVSVPLHDAADAIDRYALTEFDPGEVLGGHRLSDVGSGPLAGAIPPGMVGVDVPVATLPPGLVAGDHAVVIGTFAGPHPYTSLLADDVRIANVAEGANAGSFGSGGDPAQVVVFCDPATAEEIVRASGTGTITLAVRSASDEVALSPSPAPPLDM